MTRRLGALAALVAATWLVSPPCHAAGTPRPRPIQLASARRISLSLCTGLTVIEPQKESRDYYPYSAQPTHSGVMLRETRQLNLSPGLHQIEWEGLPETGVLETLSVREVNAVAGLTIRDVRVEESQLNPTALATLLEGAKVRVEPDRYNPITNRSTKWRPPPIYGGIVSVSEGVVLSVGSELTVLPRSRISADNLPERRRLLLSVEVPRTAKGPVAVALEVSLFVVDVTQHAPRYTFRFDPVSNTGVLAGSALITNLSGYSLNGAQAAYCLQARHDNTAKLSERFDLTPSGETATRLVPTYTRGPYRFAQPLDFGTTTQATVAVLPVTSVPAREIRYVLLHPSNLMTRVEKGADSQGSNLIHRFEIDAAPLNLGSFLPNGDTAVWLEPDAPVPLSQASLLETDEKIIRIEAQDRTTRVYASQKSFAARGKCQQRAVWNLTVPDFLAALGPLDVIIRGSPQTTQVTLGKNAPATVHPEQDQTIVRVAPVPSASKPPQSLVVELQLRHNPCR